MPKEKVELPVPSSWDGENLVLQTGMTKLPNQPRLGVRNKRVEGHCGLAQAELGKFPSDWAPAGPAAAGERRTCPSCLIFNVWHCLWSLGSIRSHLLSSTGRILSFWGETWKPEGRGGWEGNEPGTGATVWAPQMQDQVGTQALQPLAKPLFILVLTLCLCVGVPVRFCIK